MVPADRVPSILVIISAISAMFMVAVGLRPDTWEFMIFVSADMGDVAKDFNLVPDCVSQVEISPIEPIVAIRLPSLLNSASTGGSLPTSECNSRPDFKSQIPTPLTKPVFTDGLGGGP